MSLANRSEGLVLRRNVAHTTTYGGSREKIDYEAEDSKLRGVEEEDDHDSKETRLTLMEEVLLLGLKDREVNIL